MLVILYAQLLSKKVEFKEISEYKTIIITPWVNTTQFGFLLSVQFLWASTYILKPDLKAQHLLKILLPLLQDFSDKDKL